MLPQLRVPSKQVAQLQDLDAQCRRSMPWPYSVSCAMLRVRCDASTGHRVPAVYGLGCEAVPTLLAHGFLSDHSGVHGGSCQNLHADRRSASTVPFGESSIFTSLLLWILAGLQLARSTRRAFWTRCTERPEEVLWLDCFYAGQEA